MSANVLKIDISEQGEAIFQQKSTQTKSVAVPPGKKKKRLSGRGGVTVPETTQTIKVRVTHTHRHMFVPLVSNEAYEDNLEREGKHLIDVAQQIKTEKEREKHASRVEEPPQPAPAVKPRSADDDNDYELEHGHEALFPTFVFDSLYDALNHRKDISGVSLDVIENVSEPPQQPTQSEKPTVLNNTPLNRCQIETSNLLVDLHDISRRSFKKIARLEAKNEFIEAREIVKVDQSRNADPDISAPYYNRMLSNMEEENNIWARVYKELQQSGNPARSVKPTLSVAEKTELFVRCSDFRKEFFLPKHSNVSSQKLCGSYSMFTILENPNLFVLPNSGMWGSPMQQRFGKLTDGSYLQFSDFERARVRVVSSDPFLSDACWYLWNSCGDKVARCAEATMHSEVEKRDTVVNCPNTSFYEQIVENSCVCAKNGTIVLCSNANHMKHMVGQQCAPVPGQRSGANNMCIVAAETFGAATRERWILLRTICGTMQGGRHDELLVRTFLEALESDKNLRELVPCLREFGVEDQSILQTGKPHDHKVVDRLGSRVRVQKKLPAESHGRERFYLYDPIEMTLALLLFVEARMTAGWFNVWRVWVSCVQTHCFSCPFCSGPMSESLYRFVVYNAMIPVLPVTMATMLEQFALTVRCNRDLYR